MRARNENGAEAPPSATATLANPHRHHATGTDPMLTAPADGHQSRPLRYPVLTAVAHPPSGRRTRWLVITGPCVFCGGGRHRHDAIDLASAGGARRAGCQSGTYWLAISGENGHG